MKARSRVTKTTTARTRTTDQETSTTNGFALAAPDAVLEWATQPKAPAFPGPPIKRLAVNPKKGPAPIATQRPNLASEKWDIITFHLPEGTLVERDPEIPTGFRTAYHVKPNEVTNGGANPI